MTSRRYTVRRISLSRLAKFGFILGGLAMFVPGLICAAASVQIVAALRLLLEQWRKAELDLGLGLPIAFDFIELLGLESVLELITRLAEQRLILAVLIVLVALIGGGLLLGFLILLLGWVYNGLAHLTGGLEIELQE